MARNIESRDIDDLKNFVNHDQAFGPEHFNAFGVENWSIFEHLFDSENKIYKRLTTNSPLIIGRRGSGKSSFLQSRKNLMQKIKI